jgi:hypothetical protein
MAHRRARALGRGGTRETDAPCSQNKAQHRSCLLKVLVMRGQGRRGEIEVWRSHHNEGSAACMRGGANVSRREPRDRTRGSDGAITRGCAYPLRLTTRRRLIVLMIISLNLQLPLAPTTAFQGGLTLH